MKELSWQLGIESLLLNGCRSSSKINPTGVSHVFEYICINVLTFSDRILVRNQKRVCVGAQFDYAYMSCIKWWSIYQLIRQYIHYLINWIKDCKLEFMCTQRLTLNHHLTGVSLAHWRYRYGGKSWCLNNVRIEYSVKNNNWLELYW